MKRQPAVIKIHEATRDISITLDQHGNPAARFGHMPANSIDLLKTLTATTAAGEVIALPVELLVDCLKEPGMVLSIEHQYYAITPITI